MIKTWLLMAMMTGAPGQGNVTAIVSSHQDMGSCVTALHKVSKKNSMLESDVVGLSCTSFPGVDNALTLSQDIQAFVTRRANAIPK